MTQPVAPDKLCRACAMLVEENHQEEAFKQFQKFRHLYSSLSELKVSPVTENKQIHWNIKLVFFKGVRR
jgi:hypothetical protein